jgi:hypothetical protein
MAKKPKAIKKMPKTTASTEVQEMCPALRILGWRKITVDYQGSGDSCEYFKITFHDEEKQHNFEDIPDARLPPALNRQRVLESKLLNLLPCGFENNEGSDGTITIDTATGDIHVSHNNYYVECNHMEYCF